MKEQPANPWIHIGECPFCVDGLCRVRACHGGESGAHLYALCDECGSAWTEPTTDSPKTFPDLDDPRCPACKQPLYGDHAHWALAEDVNGSGWSESVIFEVLPSSGDEQGGEDLAFGKDDPKPGC